MSVKRPLITIGYDKNNQMDFGINGTVGSLSLEQMNDLRQMIPVAIFIAEDMFRRYREENLEKPKCVNNEILHVGKE